jgi:SAM-dependent methyltransferase
MDPEDRHCAKADAYDAMAEQYTALNDASMLNEHYNRPAIRRLLGDVRGHRVLDVGCGSGPNLIDLLADGAEVVGVDGSPAMVEIARKRLGPDVDVRVADAAEPLPFETALSEGLVRATGTDAQGAQARRQAGDLGGAPFRHLVLDAAGREEEQLLRDEAAAGNGDGRRQG